MSHRVQGKYWSRFLVSAEMPLHTFGVSRWYIVLVWLLPAAALVALAINVMAFISPALGMMAALVAAALMLPAFTQAFFVHYAITNQRIMSRIGVFHKSFLTVDLRSVTDVEVFETWWERLFTKTGWIGINTAGSDEVEMQLRHVARPYELRKDIYRHQQALLAPEQNEAGTQAKVQARKVSLEPN